MILLQLFWNFLVIGAVSFGGGYGMISLIREKVLQLSLKTMHYPKPLKSGNGLSIIKCVETGNGEYTL